MPNTTTILVVEDNRDTLELIGQMLDKTAYEVILTNHAYDATDVLAEKTVNLLLIDINLPRVSGIELLRQIREDLKLTTMPAIAITANPISASRQRCLDAGFDEHISKPVTRVELLGLIEKVLSQSRE